MQTHTASERKLLRDMNVYELENYAKKFGISPEVAEAYRQLTGKKLERFPRCDEMPHTEQDF